MDDFIITQNGKPLLESLYTINIKNKVFSSVENDLVLDFADRENWMFKTGSDCTFRTGNWCTFTTHNGCTFDTRYNCTFRVGSHCTFDTGECCMFSLWNINSCTFKSYNGGLSIILDRMDNEAYKLTKEFVQLRKIQNG